MENLNLTTEKLLQDIKSLQDISSDIRKTLDKKENVSEDVLKSLSTITEAVTDAINTLFKEDKQLQEKANELKESVSRFREFAEKQMGEVIGKTFGDIESLLSDLDKQVKQSIKSIQDKTIGDINTAAANNELALAA